MIGIAPSPRLLIPTRRSQRSMPYWIDHFRVPASTPLAQQLFIETPGAVPSRVVLRMAGAALNADARRWRVVRESVSHERQVLPCDARTISIAAATVKPALNAGFNLCRWQLLVPCQITRAFRARKPLRSKPPSAPLAKARPGYRSRRGRRVRVCHPTDFAAKRCRSSIIGRASALALFQHGQHLLRALDHRWRQPGELRHLDAVGAVGGARRHLVQKHDVAFPLLHLHRSVGEPRKF